MIKITENAARQIAHSAEQSGINDAVMRIAVRKDEDGSFHYAMGFDDAISKDDVRVEVSKIQLVISPSCIQLTQNMTIDYVELDGGEVNFIFLNPDDKNQSTSSAD